MVYIENDGALFRGPARGNPQEVWSRKEGKFVPYEGADEPKGVDWGEVISDEEARRMMAIPFGGGF